MWETRGKLRQGGGRAWISRERMSDAFRGGGRAIRMLRAHSLAAQPRKIDAGCCRLNANLCYGVTAYTSVEQDIAKLPAYSCARIDILIVDQWYFKSPPPQSVYTSFQALIHEKKEPSDKKSDRKKE